MRVAIVGEPSGWHVGRLAAALAARGHEAAVVRWAEITAGIVPAAPCRESFGPPALAAAEAILVRGMPGTAGPEDRLEEVIFRMDVLARLAAGGRRVINSPRALERAIDKYLSLAQLAAAGLPVPRTVVVQDAAAVADAWRQLGGDCVVKPLFGSRGRGLQRLADEAAVEAWLDLPDTRHRPQAVAYVQEFVRHGGWDARILILGDRAFAMRRRAAPGDWRTNVACGGRPEPFTPPGEWLDLARRAAATLDTEIAGVDLVPTPDGRPLVLEVNAVPGWRALESVTAVDLAAETVRHLEARR